MSGGHRGADANAEAQALTDEQRWAEAGRKVMAMSPDVAQRVFAFLSATIEPNPVNCADPAPDEPLDDGALAGIAGLTGYNGQATFMATLARECLEWRLRYTRERHGQLNRDAVPPPHVDPTVASGRKFVERAVERFVRLEQTSELEFVLEDVVNKFEVDERAFAIVAIASCAAPDTLAKLVDVCAQRQGCPDDVDPSFEVEAALVRCGIAPGRAAKVFDLFGKVPSNMEADRG